MAVGNKKVSTDGSVTCTLLPHECCTIIESVSLYRTPLPVREFVPVFK